MVVLKAALLLIVPAVLSVLAYQYHLKAEQEPQDWKVTANRIRLSDGRHIAYEIVGSKESSNPIFWFHGLASSRYEASAPRLDVLNDLDAHTIGIDRPAVGQSDPHAGRSFQSFAADVAQVADKLGIKTFFVVGVSGGGPYALATAYYLPDRVRGVLLISPASDYNLLTPQQQEEWNHFHAATWLSKAVRAAVRFAPWTLKGLARVSETRIGGRALYNSVLKGLVSALRDSRAEVDKRCIASMKAEGVIPTGAPPPASDCAQEGKIPNALANVDRKCLAAERPEHVTQTIPESQRQKTAAVLFQDVALFHTPWAFNVSEIRPEIRRATHIWQGTGDKQCPVVGAEALASAVEGSQLYIEKDGGHFAYFGCSEANRRKALSNLIKSGRSI
ncbi:g12739 [Coccomyxa viridis]|uniref:G12739 protein n=1 Tax=Coccomyxa viridis TaxID=1274662 RepID=A0ABP1GGL6_9CHLO